MVLPLTLGKAAVLTEAVSVVERLAVFVPDPDPEPLAVAVSEDVTVDVIENETVLLTEAVPVIALLLLFDIDVKPVIEAVPLFDINTETVGELLTVPDKLALALCEAVRLDEPLADLEALFVAESETDELAETDELGEGETVAELLLLADSDKEIVGVKLEEYEKLAEALELLHVLK